MKTLRLLRLSLRNFKGVREFDLEAGGADVAVFGDNATGKTTIADAWAWLLFDKDSEGKKDFEIKTLERFGAPVRGLIHSVEGEIDVDGRRLSLKRAYREVWAKKRGRAEAEFSGHTTDFWINGVPVQKKEYDAAIADICDERLFRMLSDPRFFNERLHWQERRAILMEVCGDVTDEDVIAANASLSELPNVLGGRSIEDFRKISASRRREINEQMKRIPAIINELRSMCPAAGDVDEINAQLRALRARRTELLDRRTRLESGGEIAALTKRLREVEAEIKAAENEVLGTWSERLHTLRTKRDETASEASRAARKARELIEEIENGETRLARLSARREELLEAYKVENARTFSFDGSETCAACGQPLPVEEVEAARKRAEEEWNSRRAKALERITSEGNAVRAEIQALQAAMSEKREALAQAEMRAEELAAAAQAAAAEVDAYAASQPDPSDHPAWEEAVRRAEKIQREIESARESVSDTIATVNRDLADVEQAISDAEAALAALAESQKRAERVKQLTAEERLLADELRRIESALFLCEEFVRAKVQLLTERINSRFELARFKLFDELVNGGVEECCEVTVDGVPYSSLNGGMRTNVGLDIINTLAEHYGFASVIVIDNAESVTQLLPTHGQQIRLVVSAADKALRLETKKQEVLF